MKSVISKRLTEYFQSVKEVYYKKSGMYAYPSDLERLYEEIIKVCNDNRLLKEKMQKTNDYRSVKDALPPSDGIFYDVMVILYQDNISGGWNYYRGQYQDGFFFADKGMYQLKNDFRCSWTQQKVIAWKFLEKCTNEQIDEFREKAGCL